MTQSLNRSTATAKTILDRLDTMLAELQSLRREVQAVIQTEDEETRGLADELYGALGQGSWEEMDSNADVEKNELLCPDQSRPGF